MNSLIIQDIADKLLVSKSYAEKQMTSIFKKYPEEILLPETLWDSLCRNAGSTKKNVCQHFVPVYFR